jgi:hypothetical protein
MNFIEWIGDKVIDRKEKIRENVIWFTIENNNYILKRIENLSEYLIQKDLVSLDLPIFQKDILLLHCHEPVEYYIFKDQVNEIDDEKYKDKFYILMKRIEGESIVNLIKTLDVSDLNKIIQILFWSLKSSWESLKFVHLDLHFGNILVRKFKDPITVEFKAGGKIVELETNYIPVVIDFDSSVTAKYPKVGKSDKTVLNDLWKVFGIMSMYVCKKDQGELVMEYICYFVDREVFQENKEKYACQWFNVLP